MGNEIEIDTHTHRERERGETGWGRCPPFLFYQLRRDKYAKGTTLRGGKNPAKTQSAPRWPVHVGKKAPPRGYGLNRHNLPT